jgi:hypothetical protein
MRGRDFLSAVSEPEDDEMDMDDKEDGQWW